MSGRLAEYVSARMAESDFVDGGRRAVLDVLARAVAAELRRRGAADLVFICTHNSRRSHFGQVWARIAAERFGVGGVRTWSGGTEATAFDRRAVAALERAGLLVQAEAPGSNPVYLVRPAAGAAPMRCWSKRFADAANPRDGFVAVMTCAAADEACPMVTGAAQRVAVTYDDPKAFDGTARETAAYDERCRQIAREMLYAFGRVAMATGG